MVVKRKWVRAKGEGNGLRPVWSCARQRRAGGPPLSLIVSCALVGLLLFLCSVEE